MSNTIMTVLSKTVVHGTDAILTGLGKLVQDCISHLRFIAFL